MRIHKAEGTLTPANQVVVFHSHVVSTKHADNHDVKMKPLYAHPHECR